MRDDQTLDIVFTAPHPDDLEIGCGGTIAKLVRQGYKVGMIHMTSGEPTPKGTPETRAAEAAAAAKVLGVQVMETLGLTNRELMDGPQARYAVATALRKYRPKILVGFAGRTPGASPDHYQGQLITEAARFYAQLTKWDDRFDGTAPLRIQHLVYRPMYSSAEYQLYPTRFVVDITDTFEQKLAAIACYASQFDADRLTKLRHYVTSIAGAEGGSAGFQYGESYALPHLAGTKNLFRFVSDWETPAPIAEAR